MGEGANNLDLLRVLGLDHHSAGPPQQDLALDPPPQDLDLYQLVTATTPAPHLVMEVFEHLFSEDEMNENPLVQRIHQRLHQRLEDLDSAATRNHYVHVLLLLVPVTALVALIYVASGVDAQYLGLLALLIPAYIFLTLTNFGGGGRSLTTNHVTGRGSKQ